MDVLLKKVIKGWADCFAGITFLPLHHYLQFPSGWVKLKTKYDRRDDREIYYGSFTSSSPPLMCAMGKHRNTIDNDDDDVIVLTRYGLIVGGTKGRHQYKYFGEPIAGWYYHW